MGLNGRLPWHDREDLLWFRRKTMGGVLICGVKTLAGLPESVHEGRRIIAWTRENLDDVIREVRAIESPVWVIGGAETYRVWAPHIDRWHISKIDYDGPADTWFDPTLISDLGLGPVPPAAEDVQKYIKDMHQERDDLESALRSLMDWTVQNVDAPDCAPYNYAARLLRRFGAENGTTQKGANHDAG